MKEHRSHKSYNSRLTRWVDRLLPFDFNIEHMPRAKMGLVDYISRQSKQEAKVTNKYDEEFAVATISHIRDAIVAIYVNTTQQTANHSTLTVSITRIPHVPRRASHPRLTNYSNSLSTINRNTTQLLLQNSANATQIPHTTNFASLPNRIHANSKIVSASTQIHSISSKTMSSKKSNPQNPPTHSKVTFQSTPNSAANTTRSSNEGPTSPNLDLSREEVFENNLSQLFTKGFLDVLTVRTRYLKRCSIASYRTTPNGAKR